jgi:gas vesicle protein
MRYAHQPAASGHFSLAFFSGVAIGVALGMLFAPYEGRQLRFNLSDGAQRFGRKTMDTYNDAADRVGDFVERGRSATSAGREAFRRTREHVGSETGAHV